MPTASLVVAIVYVNRTLPTKYSLVLLTD
jgi:hypothetical protein